MKPPRLQLFEFNDAPWAPEALRALVIETLSDTLAAGRLLDGLVPAFRDFLADSQATALLDLGSGSAAPAELLLSALAAAGLRPHLRLTDLQPRVAAWEGLAARWPGQVDHVADPVDATAIPEAVGAGRARVIIHMLHHLPPALVRQVLADAVACRSPIFVSESFGRTPLAFLLGFGPHALPALWRRVRAGRTPSRLLLPGVLAGAWDGLVSTLRVYEEADIRQLLGTVAGAERFTWRFGTHPVTRGFRGVWFSGIPTV